MKLTRDASQHLFGGTASVGATSGSDQFGRDTILKFWQEVVGGDLPALPELQLVQCKARQESNYGKAVYHGPDGSEVLLNWGGVQASHGPPCGDDSFLVTDHHEDGTAFNFCYKRYPDPESGCKDFMHTLLIAHGRRDTVLAAAKTGSVQDFAQAIHDSGYSELKVEKAVQSYWKNVNELANNLGEPLAVHLESGSGPDSSPTIPDGSAPDEGGSFLVPVVILVGGAALIVWSKHR